MNILTLIRFLLHHKKVTLDCFIMFEFGLIKTITLIAIKKS